MEINLYIYSGDNRVANKASGLQFLTTQYGTLRYPASIINPTIRLDISKFKDTQGLWQDFIIKCNYFTIPEFARSYYITSKILDNNNIVTITGHVDVLHTYYDDYINLGGFVSRSASNFNLMIADNNRPYELAHTVYEYVPAFNNLGNITRTVFSWDNISDYRFYVTTFSTRSGFPSNQQIDPCYDNIVDLPSYKSYAIGMSDYKSHNATNYNGVSSIIYHATLNSDSFGSFVGSIVAFPFAKDQGTTDLTVGWFVGEGDHVTELPSTVHYKQVKHAISSYLYVASFNFGVSNDYTLFEPYMQVEFYLPFIGYVPMNIVDIQGKRILVYYIVNYEDGSATAYVYAFDDKATTFNPSKAKLVYSHDCQIGISIPKSANNQEQLKAMLESARISSTIGGISGAIQVIAGIASKNPIMVASGGVSITNAVVSYAQTEKKAIPSASVNLQGGVTSKISPLEFRVRITKMKTSVTNETVYGKEFGYPLEDGVSDLSALSGMTQIREIILDDLVAMDEEKEELRGLLSSGVIL